MVPAGIRALGRPAVWLNRWQAWAVCRGWGAWVIRCRCWGRPGWPWLCDTGCAGRGGWRFAAGRAEQSGTFGWPDGRRPRP